MVRFFNSRQRLIRSLVEERAAVLGKYGFRFFLLSNGHGGPRHVVALEEAAHRASKKYRLKVVSLSGRIAFEFLTGKYAAAIESKMGRSFTEEEKRCFAQDSHAGWWETSVMLMLKPELVDKNYQELSAFTKDWKNHFGRKKSIKDPGYRGFPALANRTFADATVHVLLEKLMELIEDMLQGKELGKRAYSPLYKLGFFRTNFIWYAVILFTTIITIVLIVLI